MNATDNGPDYSAEREILFAEIHTVRQQRNDLMRELAACRAECSELRSELARLREES